MLQILWNKINPPKQQEKDQPHLEIKTITLHPSKSNKPKRPHDNRRKHNKNHKQIQKKHAKPFDLTYVNISTTIEKTTEPNKEPIKSWCTVKVSDITTYIMVKPSLFNKTDTTNNANPPEESETTAIKPTH
jgi:hypothetical protein